MFAFCQLRLGHYPNFQILTKYSGQPQTTCSSTYEKAAVQCRHALMFEFQLWSEIHSFLTALIFFLTFCCTTDGLPYIRNKFSACGMMFGCIHCSTWIKFLHFSIGCKKVVISYLSSKSVCCSLDISSQTFLCKTIKLTPFFKEVTMDLIRLAWCNSNKRVTLSFKQRGSRSVAVMRHGCYANGFCFDSHLVNFTFFFFTFFQVYVLPLQVSVRLGLH